MTFYLKLEIAKKKAENEEKMKKISDIKQSNSFMLNYCKAHGIEIPGKIDPAFTYFLFYLFI